MTARARDTDVPERVVNSVVFFGFRVTEKNIVALQCCSQRARRAGCQSTLDGSDREALFRVSAGRRHHAMLRAALPSGAGPAAPPPRARPSRRRASSRPSARRGARVEDSTSGSGDPPPSVVADAPRDDKPRHNRRGDNASRDRFADTLRESHSGGRISKRDFKSHLGKLSDPPAALRDVTVVLVGTKKAGNVGAIARACGSFECEDLRVVSPRCDPKTRASLSAAKGAQHIVHGAGVYDTLEDALLDVDKAVAFHVWCDGLEPERARDVDALIKTFPGGRGFFSRAKKDDEVNFETDEETSQYPRRDPDTQNPVVPLFVGARRARIRGVSGVGEDANARKRNVAVRKAEKRVDETRKETLLVDKKKNDEEALDDETSDVVVHGWRRRSHVTEPANRAGRGSGKLALVFGREVEGLTDDEVNACDAVCAIPTGRLIESLSVSHAAVIILSQYYQSRRGGEEE